MPFNFQFDISFRSGGDQPVSTQVVKTDEGRWEWAGSVDQAIELSPANIDISTITGFYLSADKDVNVYTNAFAETNTGDDFTLTADSQGNPSPRMFFGDPGEQGLFTVDITKFFLEPVNPTEGAANVRIHILWDPAAA